MGCVRVVDRNGALRIASFGSGDLVTKLINAQVAITGGVTLTSSAFGKMHKVTGASGSYTITLPAASGNAGKIIGFYVGDWSSSPYDYALDGNGSEKVDGLLLIRMCWNNRVILYCDGTGWWTLEAEWDNNWVDQGGIVVTSSGSAPGKGGVTSDHFFIRRSGRTTFDIAIDFYQSGVGGSAGTGFYVYSLPFSLSFDNLNFAVDTDTASGGHLSSCWGSGTVYSHVSDIVSFAHVVMYSPSLFRILMGSSTVNFVFADSGNLPFNSKQSCELQATLPMSGWG